MNIKNKMGTLMRKTLVYKQGIASFSQMKKSESTLPQSSVSVKIYT